MKVRIKQPHAKLPGEVGDVVEIEATLGHHFAGIGKAVVVEHDKPDLDGCVVRLSEGTELAENTNDGQDEVSKPRRSTRPVSD